MDFDYLPSLKFIKAVYYKIYDEFLLSNNSGLNTMFGGHQTKSIRIVLLKLTLLIHSEENNNKVTGLLYLNSFLMTTPDST